jgi:hypothetical protein
MKSITPTLKSQQLKPGTREYSLRQQAKQDGETQSPEHETSLGMEEKPYYPH